MNSLSEQKVTVTGGAGFIGFHLSDALHALGADVDVVDNLSASGSPERAEKLRKSGFKVVVRDIRHKNKLLKEVGKTDLIFHLAALSSVPLSYEKPRLDCQINVLGTVSVLEAARRSDAKVVFTSSSTVYGMPIEVPTPESHPLSPISFYGLSKLVAEQYCNAYHQTYGLPVTIIRLFNVYGPESTSGVTYDFLRKIMVDNKQLGVIGSGEQKKDFIYVDDAVDALLKASKSNKTDGEVYNVGSGETTNVVELAELILNLLGLNNKTKIITGICEDWSGDVTFTHADITKIRKHLNWCPKTNMTDGLKQTIRWFESAYGPIVR